MIARDTAGTRSQWMPLMVLMAAILAGLLARSWIVLYSPVPEFAADQLFDTLAWNLAALYAFTLNGLNPAAHVGPLYPVVLAVFYAFVGHRPEWVPVLHSTFDLASAFCIYRVATVLWGSWTGACAAGLFMVYLAESRHFLGEDTQDCRQTAEQQAIDWAKWPFYAVPHLRGSLLIVGQKR